MSEINMNKDGFYGSGGAGSATPIGGGGVGNSDVNWRLDQLVADMNIMWSKIAELETTRDSKSEPYDVMDSFRSSKIERDACEPVNRYFVDCLKENAKLIEENDVLKYQYETMHKETVRCKKQLAETESKVFTKQLQIDELRKENEKLQPANLYYINSLEENARELTKANAYWEDLCQRLQMENADLKYRSNHFEIVEYQTARECTEIVNRIKNDSLTTAVRDANSKKWMEAICEDIEREIKKEYGLK